MKRHVGLIALLVILALLGTMFGPFVLRLLGELSAEYRAIRELARRERYREEHPPVWPFAQLRCSP